MGKNCDIEKLLDLSVNLAKEAGKIITEAIWRDKNILTKSSTIDFVTESDQKVEKFLFSGIAKECPDHRFIGEESTNEKLKLTDEPTWIIDPIDGTMNFVHGNPLVCISIGFYNNKEGEFGIIYNPVFNELYTAIKGKGAFLNGNPIKVSGTLELDKALVCFEGGTSRDPAKMQCVIENFTSLYPKIHGFRSYGTAAISMSMVAKGAVDAYFESGPHIWDMAAGAIIIREAGGVMIDPSGEPLDLMSRQFLCASSLQLALELSKNIKMIKQQRDDE